MSEGGEGRAANEVSSFAMDQGADLLASLGDACDLECHLDLADIGEDWVSLMMLDAGSDSTPVSGDISFSDISCPEVGPSNCSREQVHDGSGSDPGSQSLFPADRFWDGIESGGTSATSSLFMSKDGSDCDLVFDTSSNQLFAHLQSNFPHISLRNSPVTGSPFSHMSFSSPEDGSSWPSPHSSFMETEGSNGFLLDADLECLTDQVVGFPGSDLPNRSAEVVHYADTCSAEGVNNQSCEAKLGREITPSGSQLVVLSSQANPAASSSGSAGGRVDKGSPRCESIDVLRPGEDQGESPISSMKSISLEKTGDRHCTRFEGRVEQPDTTEENMRIDNGEALKTGRYEIGVMSSDERIGESYRDRPKGDNGNVTGIKCEKELENDLVHVEASEDSSPIVPSRWKYTSKSALCAEEQEQTSKGTKRKGEDRSLPRPSGSACSDGQHSDVSDGDKKDTAGDAGEEDDEKRKARLMRNRESAQQSRQRKKIYVDELEQKLRTMAATIAELNATISHLTAENVNLRRQLGYLFQPNPALAGRPPVMVPPLVPLPPYPGMYGMRPMIPGVPAPPIPIPRLKPQSSVSKTTKKAAKAPAAGEDVGSDKKRRRKAAKAASVGILSLFCFIMVIGPYSWGLPELESSRRLEHRNMARVGMRVLNSWEDEHEPKSHWLPLMSSWSRYLRWSTRQYDTDTSFELLHERRSPYRSRDLSLSKQVNRESIKRVMRNATNITGRATSRQVKARRRENDGESLVGTSSKRKAEVNSSAVFIGGMLFANASEPFPASLSVPRNNQLVKIEGSLIIQAIMAGDQAAAMRHSNPRNMEEAKDSSGKVLQGASKHLLEGQEEQGLALEGTSRQVLQELSPKLSGEQGSGASDKGLVRASAVKSQALSAKQEATYSSKLLPANKAGDHFSQLIMDDVTGLGLSTGICTEVFQFDATPVVGHVARPRAAKSDATQNRTDNKDQSRHRRGRRDPFAIPLPPAQTQASELRNKTHDRTISGDEGFKGKSSMVVSVFTALQDVKDEDRTMANGAKGGTKIFVVILVDGVKYVTYSCPLPPSKSHPQVVAG